ncbi:asparagine synthetase B family protein [Desulfobacter latus]|uniref:asparagine synthase (glutamine-hydrolyzing) n=1 Tax=Desulfobacter latus TaxID=2292 RepID=A0A850SXK5_9BACT|nr:asparagine synthetase B [Desulfobacter latus]NWH03401.1 hypothetical protein [Desulfobacter latus]
MTAIAGIIYFDKKPVDPGVLERMKNILEPYGRDAQHIWKEPGAGVLRMLSRITPEDAMDEQPLISADGNRVVVFDGRIDNRDELADKLDITPRQSRIMADSAFALKAFERWDNACLDYLLGDFAFAVWNRQSRRLFLARDPLGLRPLYWHKTNRFFAFATLSKGLFAIPDVPRQLCEARMADYLALLPMKGPESFYQDIYRIEPGHFLILENGSVRTHRYHAFDPEHRIHLKNDDDYVAAARELLDKAVFCRLRSTGGVASHLSSGLDSSTVTATAARLLETQGKRLTAFTSVPREGFDGPVPKGRHGDEGPPAAALAAKFSNIDHILFRPENRTPVDGLHEKVETLDRAPLNLCNHVWIEGIQADAARRGARVLLTGQMGNMTISYDGRPRLPNLLRRGQFLEWLKEVHAMALHTDTRLRGAMMQSLGPFLPVPFWRAFNAWKGRGSGSLHDYTAIHPDLINRTHLHDRACQAGWDLSYRPWADGWRMRTAVIYRMDPGDYLSACVGGDGIEMRDPTSDLRLLTYCLAIPEDQYFKNGQSRRLLHRLIGHILPPEILQAKTKGLQAVDWYEGATAGRDEIKAWLDRLESTTEVPRYLDLKRMRTLVENWPQKGWAQDNIVKTYRLCLLRGLSVGAFIHYVEGGNR